MTRFGHVMTTYFSVLLFGGLAFAHPAPKLIWNATASTPVGLYVVRPDRHPTIGDLVVIRPPEPLAKFLAEGGYLPRGLPLLKQIAADAGDTVCRSGATVTIDGIAVATAHERDHLGRPLPAWSGCRTLGTGELFLLNRHPDSLDGRYFGPIPASAVLGRAHPLFLVPSTHGANP
jgi:conjugative transfer signal peptidase TraF